MNLPRSVLLAFFLPISTLCAGVKIDWKDINNPPWVTSSALSTSSVNYANAAGYSTNAGYATNADTTVGGWRNPIGFTYTVTDVPRGTPSSTAYITNQDLVYAEYTRNPTKHDKWFNLSVSHADVGAGVTLSVWPTNLASATDAIITHISDGTVTAQLYGTSGGCIYTQSFSLVTDSSVSTNYFGGVSGSVYYAAATAIDSILTNPTPDTALFSTLNNTTTNYVRNTNCWAKSLDTTPAAVWHNSSGVGSCFMGATLISPKHFVAAAHYRLIGVGTKVYFVASNNAVVSRTVTGLQNCTNDLDIGLLDSNVPAGINYCSIMTNNLTKLPHGVAGLPVLVIDQYNRAQCWDTVNLDYAIQRSPLASRYAAYIGLISGDSGHPSIMYVGTTPVLLGGFLYIGGGTGLGPYVSAINTTMLALGGTNQVSVVDLSAYTSF